MANLCPKCRTTNLSRSALELAEVVPLRCVTCNGFWLTAEETSLLIKHQKKLREDVVPKPRDPARDRLPAFCPMSHGVMPRARVEGDTTFHLEQCVTCLGIWFDVGEWELLVVGDLFRHLRKFWTPGWQRRMQGVNSRKAHLARVSQKLGPEMYARIMRLAVDLRSHPGRFDALAFLEEEVRLHQDERTFNGLLTTSGEVGAFTGEIIVPKRLTPSK